MIIAMWLFLLIIWVFYIFTKKSLKMQSKILVNLLIYMKILKESRALMQLK